MRRLRPFYVIDWYLIILGAIYARHFFAGWLYSRADHFAAPAFMTLSARLQAHMPHPGSLRLKSAALRPYARYVDND